MKSYALGCGFHINNALYASGAVELARYLHGTLRVRYRIIFQYRVPVMRGEISHN